MLKLIGGSRLALHGLLVTSLAINGVLLLRDRASASEASPRAKAKTPTEKPSNSSAVPLARCQRQLRVVQLRAANLTQARLASLMRPPADPAAEDPPEPAGASDYTAQQEMLCTIGVEQLRKNWEHGHEVVYANLVRDLQNDHAQARDLRRTLETYGDALDLSARQRSTLERAYRPLRDRRSSAALKALQADPPDYLAAFDEAQDLYSDTDELVRKLHGRQGMERVRHADLRRRTLVLAVLASLADVDWDRSIEW